MAAQCVAGDIHLTSGNSSGFTTSQGSYSIAVWINATSWSNAATQSFVGIYGPSPTPTAALQIGTRGGGLVDCWTWGGTLLVSSAVVVANAVWHHVVYTFDGTSHRLYVDGSLSNTAAIGQQVGQFTTVYINGYPTGGAGETAAYEVDSYAYYDRTLSDGEIMTIFNGRGARHGIVDGLLAEYDFDELAQGLTCTAISDLSGRGNNLAVAGAGTTPITYSYAGAIASSNIRRVH